MSQRNEETSPNPTPRPGSSSPRFRFRSGGGAASRVAQKLQFAASELLAGDPGSESSVSLSILDEAISHFLRERGLGSARGRRVRESYEGSGSAPTKGSIAQDYRSSPAWLRDEEARLRLKKRLERGVAHDEIAIGE